MAGLKHRYGALNWSPCHDQLARLAELVDTELYHVSSFKVLRRSHAKPTPAGAPVLTISPEKCHELTDNS